MEIDLSTTIDALKDNGVEFITSYMNGEEGYWGFNKDRSIEVTIKIKEMPDADDIENFEEHIKEDKCSCGGCEECVRGTELFNAVNCN